VIPGDALPMSHHGCRLIEIEGDRSRIEMFEVIITFNHTAA
jgi:hypothetical protein